MAACQCQYQQQKEPVVAFVAGGKGGRHKVRGLQPRADFFVAARPPACLSLPSLLPRPRRRRRRSFCSASPSPSRSRSPPSLPSTPSTSSLPPTHHHPLLSLPLPLSATPPHPHQLCHLSCFVLFSFVFSRSTPVSLPRACFSPFPLGSPSWLFETLWLKTSSLALRWQTRLVTICSRPCKSVRHYSFSPRVLLQVLSLVRLRLLFSPIPPPPPHHARGPSPSSVSLLHARTTQHGRNTRHFAHGRLQSWLRLDSTGLARLVDSALLCKRGSGRPFAWDSPSRRHSPHPAALADIDRSLHTFSPNRRRPFFVLGCTPTLFQPRSLPY